MGGYGRAELSPASDIDLLFLVRPRSEVSKATLRGLLYPLWDAGWQVGHAVRTPKEAVERAGIDLDAATASLSARLVAGSSEHFDEFQDRLRRWVSKERKNLIRRINDSTTQRHQRVDRAGWVLAPDLKDDVGGLRDVHRLGWLSAVTSERTDDPRIATAYELLVAVREALHAEAERKLDRVRIDLQPRLAARLGLEDERAADELMAEVHSAARTIEARSEGAADTLSGIVLGGPKRSGAVRELGGGIRIEDGYLTVEPGLPPEPGAAMRLIAAYAATGRALSGRARSWIEGAFGAGAFGVGAVERWDAGTRDAFLEILAAPHVTAALELLDHVDALRRLLPEWSRVRGLAQHDPYHRYTVDGHLFVAMAEVHRVMTEDPFAKIAAQEAGDLHALRLATLLHDVGKGSGFDHSVAGEEIARSICTRIGVDDTTAHEVPALVRHHLLLVDTATRRDLDDGAVISEVAETIGDPRLLRLLYILSVADGMATGPEGWSEWKGALTKELFRKTLIALETGEVPTRSDVVDRAREVEAYEPSLAGRAQALLETLPPSYLESSAVEDVADELRLLLKPPQPGEVRYRVYEGAVESTIAVCTVDRPGTLARTAGVLSLNRISVLRAQAFSTTTGHALERFIVRSGEPDALRRFTSDLEAAYSGRLALEARLDRKVADYSIGTRVEANVRVLNDASAHSTVVEVRAPDTLGLLYAIAAALTDLDLDIHVAKIDTLGERVVDSFYVRTSSGGKLNEEQAAEVERSIVHRIDRLFNR